MMISSGTLVNVKLYAYRNEAIGDDDEMILLSDSSLLQHNHSISSLFLPTKSPARHSSNVLINDSCQFNFHRSSSWFLKCSHSIRLCALSIRLPFLEYCPEIEIELGGISFVFRQKKGDDRLPTSLLEIFNWIGFDSFIQLSTIIAIIVSSLTPALATV